MSTLLYALCISVPLKISGLIGDIAYEFVRHFVFSKEKVEISSINAHADFRGEYTSSTDFLELNSLPTQP